MSAQLVPPSRSPFVRFEPNEKSIPMDWIEPLNVIAVMCFKGGVGKTGYTSATAVMLAKMGFTVLVIDFNRQANLAEDFGLEQTGEDEDGNPIFADGGRALADSIVRGEPLKPIQVPLIPAPLAGEEDVQPIPGRENIWICPGGPELDRARSHVFVVGENSAPTVLAVCLKPVAANYDVVLIDCPPEDRDILRVCAGAARWLWIPTRTDPASLRGFNTCAGIYKRVKKTYNEHLEILGTAIYATTFPEEGPVIRGIRAFLEERLNGVGAVAPHVIPYAESVALNGRSYGMTAVELEEFGLTGAIPNRELVPIQRNAKFQVRLFQFMWAEMLARRAGHAPGAVERIDDDGNPVYRVIQPAMVGES